MIARAIMAIARCCLGESRRDWSAAMQAEFEAARIDGGALPFAVGCLGAAMRELLTREEGRFTLTSYALVLGLMIPMAAVQVGCALFGLPYLYPGESGLTGALLIGGAYEGLVRATYQAMIPALALILLTMGVGHLLTAWAMLERDWERVRRMGSFTLAAAVTLVIVMSVFFLDCTQALLQAGVLAVELATLTVVARRHAELQTMPKHS